MKKRSLIDVFAEEDGVWTARDAVRKHLGEISTIKAEAPGITWSAIVSLLLRAGIIERRISAKTLANYYHEAKAAGEGATAVKPTRGKATATKPKGAKAIHGLVIEPFPTPERVQAARVNDPAKPAASVTERRLSPPPEAPAFVASPIEAAGKYPIFDPEKALSSVEEPAQPDELLPDEPMLDFADDTDFPEPEPPMADEYPTAPLVEPEPEAAAVKQDIKKRIALKM